MSFTDPGFETMSLDELKEWLGSNDLSAASYSELLNQLAVDLPTALPGVVQSSIGGSSGSVSAPAQGSTLAWDVSQQLYVPTPSTPSYIAVPITAAFGGGTATFCRKFYDGTVEWVSNLYTTGQPSASSIQVTSGLDSSLVPGDVWNSGWILANYDDAVPYVAYFPNSPPYELWVRTLDGSSRTEWNPIFNSLRYSTR